MRMVMLGMFVGLCTLALNTAVHTAIGRPPHIGWGYAAMDGFAALVVLGIGWNVKWKRTCISRDD
jgi:hypothetical protein